MQGVADHRELGGDDREYVDLVERWLALKGVDLARSPCTACRQTAWVVMRLMAAPVTDLNQLTYQNDGRLSSHILVPLMCGNCAQVVFFNAVAMGLPLDTVTVHDGESGPS
jgi:hypothetical protein